MVPIFVFWNISFKVCNNACIMRSSGTLKRIYTFHTKISYSTKNYVHMAKKIRIRKLKMVTFETKTLLYLRSSNYLTNRNGKKTQQFSYYK